VALPLFPDPANSAEPNVIIRRVFLLSLGPVCIGMIPLFAKMFGVQFLPSTSWVANAYWPSFMIGLLASLVFFWVFWRMWRRSPPETRSTWRITVMFFGAWMFLVLTMDAVIVGAPLFIALSVGTDTSETFIVEKAQGYSDRKCPNQIRLRELVFMYSELCGFSDEFRDGLEPGQSIAVSGRGTSLGLFVNRARAVAGP
jgi:hypothetical protein